MAETRSPVLAGPAKQISALPRAMAARVRVTEIGVVQAGLATTRAKRAINGQKYQKPSVCPGFLPSVFFFFLIWNSEKFQDLPCKPASLGFPMHRSEISAYSKVS